MDLGWQYSQITGRIKKKSFLGTPNNFNPDLKQFSTGKVLNAQFTLKIYKTHKEISFMSDNQLKKKQTTKDFRYLNFRCGI